MQQHSVNIQSIASETSLTFSFWAIFKFHLIIAYKGKSLMLHWSFYQCKIGGQFIKFQVHYGSTFKIGIANDNCS